MHNDYNFWADLFDTYQSLTLGLQTGWMLALLIFATIVNHDHRPPVRQHFRSLAAASSPSRTTE